jgi:hypothetical protein
MSPRTRVALVVAVAAAAAAGATVAATVLIWGGDSHAARQVGLRPGAPPFLLDELGLRNDPEAQRLRRAEQLYGRGDRAAAGRVLAGDTSLGARVGAALARWPRATITELDGLAHAHPRSAFVRLHLGLALLWARRDTEARQAWRAAERVGPDSPSAVRAETLLHPELAPGLPVFVPTFGPQSTFPSSPQAQLAAFARAARRPDWRAKILYGVALQRLERPVSAERQYAAAAALALRQGAALARLRTARTAREDVPARPDRPLPPRPAPPLDWTGPNGEAGAPPGPRGRAENPFGKPSRGPFGPSRALGPTNRKMSRTAYGEKAMPLAECRIRESR